MSIMEWFYDLFDPDALDDALSDYHDYDDSLDDDGELDFSDDEV